MLNPSLGDGPSASISQESWMRSSRSPVAFTLRQREEVVSSVKPTVELYEELSTYPVKPDLVQRRSGIFGFCFGGAAVVEKSYPFIRSRVHCNSWIAIVLCIGN